MEDMDPVRHRAAGEPVGVPRLIRTGDHREILEGAGAAELGQGQAGLVGLVDDQPQQLVVALAWIVKARMPMRLWSSCSAIASSRPNRFLTEIVSCFAIETSKLTIAYKD